jgi:hypothetical protein
MSIGLRGERVLVRLLMIVVLFSSKAPQGFLMPFHHIHLTSGIKRSLVHHRYICFMVM